MASALLDSLLDEDTLRSTGGARLESAQALLRDGLPRARDEAWKYTSLRALEQKRYAHADANATTRAVDTQVFALPAVEGACIVFVNGRWREDLSCLPQVEGLGVAFNGGDAPQRARADGAAARADAFVRLNSALAQDGLALRVAAGVRIAEPVHLVVVGAVAETDVAWHVCCAIELGEGASLRLIEHHVGVGEHAHLGNVLADYTLAAEARLDLLQIQQAAATSTLVRRDRFRLDRAAALGLHTLEIGSLLLRHEIEVDLAGSGARFDSRGVFALRGRQHADTHLVVTHSARDSACDIAWRGVADERARGVFHGAITVAAGADGADAKLSNKNLLLSAQAEIDTQPALEIHADEVKAAHGATVGQLDERALFYLRSRGIPLELARSLLVGAFCKAMFADLQPVELRAHLESLLAQRMPLAEAAA